jgi:HEAT repeat protein
MADSVAEQIAALKDEDWAIREEAATMLGTLRDPRAVAPLVSVLRDDDRAVR